MEPHIRLTVVYYIQLIASAHSSLKEVTEPSDKYFDLNMFIGLFYLDVGGSETLQGSVRREQ